MIELFEQDERQNDRQSSKGNQLKWKNNGIWYKADYTGYEGLAEYMVSHLLLKSSLRQDEFVLYEPEQIRYKDTVYSGVKSNDFLEKGWQLITLERLFKTFFGQSLYQSIFKISAPEKRLIFLVEQVERVTNLRNFGVYINKLFTIDAFFLNEDSIRLWCRDSRVRSSRSARPARSISTRWISMRTILKRIIRLP